MLSLGKSLFKSIPIAGTIFDLLDKVADAVYGEFKEREFKDKVTAINNVMLYNKEVNT